MKEGRDDRSVVQVWDLKWGVSTPGGGGHQLDGIPPLSNTTCEKSAISEDNLGTPHRAFPASSLFVPRAKLRNNGYIEIVHTAHPHF